MPIAAATGLATGMLAIHSFADDTDEEELLSAPRHHRQASAELPGGQMNNSNHVVIGLLVRHTTGPQQANEEVRVQSDPRRSGILLRLVGYDCFSET